MKKKDWIDKATKNAHGQFAAAAKKSGMTTAQFVRHVIAHDEDFSAKRVKQARLARTLMRM